MSKDVVIKVENVSKLYRLGQVGTGTLSHDLKRWWALARGKEDPYQKVGVVNDRTRKTGDEYAWALKDIDFDIKQGDTLGIIGKNGAGKSTLLKLLSRVTSPTTGSIKVKGRIASLLEVGTGFHPELTGKENIYMNGAILGMTKREIDRKFDEIVDFAGVAMYINTPVKRYSSGMYVRLAFGVAAHLEPEILIVDEVLAVGDAEFQKKCLGKMGDVASDGRTIIFVSHNMQAVQALCKTSLYLKSGQIAQSGPTENVINTYLSKEVKSCVSKTWDDEATAPGNDLLRLVAARVEPKQQDETDPITVATEIDVVINFLLHKEYELNIGLNLFTAGGLCIFSVASPIQSLSKGVHTGRLKIPGRLLNDDIYTVSIFFVKDGTTKIFSAEDVLTFEIVDEKRTGAWFGKWGGAIRPALPFELT